MCVGGGEKKKKRGRKVAAKTQGDRRRVRKVKPVKARQDKALIKNAITSKLYINF